MGIKRVLVVGGTGMIGQPVTRQLVKEGFEVTVGTRFQVRVEDLFGSSVEARVLDLSDPVSVAASLENQDAVHLSLPSGPRFEDCFRNETETTRLVANAAAKAGIKQISYLSGGNVGADVDFPPIQAKWQAEEAIRASGVPFTIWRATWFMETLTKLVKGLFVVVLGKGKTPVHWLAGEDFGMLVAKSFRSDNATDKTFYPFGPESLSYMETVKIFRNICHSNKMIITMPIGVAISMGKLIGIRELWFGAQLLKFLDTAGEGGNPEEMNSILGPTTTTLTQFAEKIKG